MSAALAFDSAGTTLLAGRSGVSEPVRVVLSPNAPKGPFMPNQRVGEGDPLEYVTGMACLDDTHALLSQDNAHSNNRPELMNIDPSRLPPAYRGRIQKYFQRLSEK